MNPNLAQAVAAERRADMRRDAAAYRRARGHSAQDTTAGAAQVGQPRADRNPVRTQSTRRIHLVPIQRHQDARDATARPDVTDRSADEVLVLPSGATTGAESADLCSAGFCSAGR
jgi:uncharacterized protein YfaQ (DUF2300 family)